MGKNGKKYCGKNTSLNLCIWYKSKSIEECNRRWYLACHTLCDGLNKDCEKYLSQSELDKLLQIHNVSGDYKEDWEAK